MQGGVYVERGSKLRVTGHAIEKLHVCVTSMLASELCRAVENIGRMYDNEGLRIFKTTYPSLFGLYATMTLPERPQAGADVMSF